MPLHPETRWPGFPRASPLAVIPSAFGGGNGRRQSIPASRQNWSRGETSHRAKGLQQVMIWDKVWKSRKIELRVGRMLGQREDPSLPRIMGGGLTFHFDQGEGEASRHLCASGWSGTALKRLKLGASEGVVSLFHLFPSQPFFRVCLTTTSSTVPAASFLLHIFTPFACPSDTPHSFPPPVSRFL